MKSTYGGWAAVRTMICSLVIVLSTAAGLQAEEPPTYGLDDLIRMGMENSPELLEAEESIAIAQSYLDQAKAGQWAQMDVIGVGGVINDAERPVVRITPDQVAAGIGGSTIEAEIEEGKIDDEETDIGPFGRLEFTIIQPIYTFGKIGYRKKAAMQGVAVERVSMEQEKGEIVRKIKKLYFSLILAKQGAEVADETDTFIVDARKRIKKLIEIGSANVDESDLYRLEAYAAETKSFKAKAVAGARMARFALAQTVGLPPEQDFNLDMKELPKDARALSTEDDYIQSALDLRPEFDQLKLGIEAKRLMVKAATADLYPSLFVAGVGRFAGAPGREHLDEPYIGDGFNKADAGGFVGANWHFDLGIGRAKVRKARAEYRKLQHMQSLAKRDIPLQVAKYYNDAVEQQASFQAYEEAAKSARKWIVVAFSNFDMGIGSVRDIFFAVERYGKNQGEFLRALYKYHTALVDLSYAAAEYRTSLE